MAKHSDILIEDFNSKFDAIMEAVGSMQDSVKKIPKMAERLEKLESDMAKQARSYLYQAKQAKQARSYLYRSYFVTVTIDWPVRV